MTYKMLGHRIMKKATFVIFFSIAEKKQASPKSESNMKYITRQLKKNTSYGRGHTHMLTHNQSQ